MTARQVVRWAYAILFYVLAIAAIIMEIMRCHTRTK